VFENIAGFLAVAWIVVEAFPVLVASEFMPDIFREIIGRFNDIIPGHIHFKIHGCFIRIFVDPQVLLRVSGALDSPHAGNEQTGDWKDCIFFHSFSLPWRLLICCCDGCLVETPMRDVMIALTPLHVGFPPDTIAA
jgi:hypothetical protein